MKWVGYNIDRRVLYLLHSHNTLQTVLEPISLHID